MAKVLHPVIDCNPRVVYEADVFWSFVLLDFGDRTKTAVAPTPGTLLEFWWTFGGLGQGLLTDTPFFVTESARLPAAVQHLGHEPL